MFTLLSFQILFVLHQGSGASYQELPKDPKRGGGFSIQDILQNCLQNSHKMQGRSEVLNYLLYNLHIDEKVKWNNNVGCKSQQCHSKKGFNFLISVEISISILNIF